ncbi:gremlin-1-like [Hydractinia symbiolongicarpus]|uniref:gremlin-1-like n=1 Tax=Hydractinia symbiolongicarpus TaxID=13093 RepID=UPI00254DAA42|nr:gremlin-1-like [Hydractinia symbiolongicarpus]
MKYFVVPAIYFVVLTICHCVQYTVQYTKRTEPSQLARLQTVAEPTHKTKLKISDVSSTQMSCMLVKSMKIIKIKGCRKKIMEDGYCTGQCNSIYVPNKKQLQYASSCFPASYERKTVTLKCGKRGRRKYTYVTIKACKCRRAKILFKP